MLVVFTVFGTAANMIQCQLLLKMRNEALEDLPDAHQALVN